MIWIWTSGLVALKAVNSAVYVQYVLVQCNSLPRPLHHRQRVCSLSLTLQAMAARILTLALLSLITFTNAWSLHRRAAIDDCLAKNLVPVDKAGSANWTADISPFNARLPYTPAAVAVPTTIPQIQAAVNCGRGSGLKVTAKGGGHSYASSGLGGENGHLVIQLDRMFNVTLNKKTNVATVQPGARLGHVANELFKQGKRAISAGTCPG